MADCNVCLSLAGGLMRQNLFLEFVRDAINHEVMRSRSITAVNNSMKGFRMVEQVIEIGKL